MDTGEDAQQDHYISSSADETDSSSDEEPWLDVEQDTVLPKPHVPFMENVGPKHMPPRDAPPIGYFNLYFTASFISIIVTETNRYAQQFLENNDISEYSRGLLSGFLSVIWR